MTSSEIELWGDFNWEEPSEPIAEPFVHVYEDKRVDGPNLGRSVGRIAISLCVIGSALAGLGILADRHKPFDQVPKFSATKVGDCYVSTEWKWVWPRNGIDDLVIHDVEGVNAESGPGSECLMAARRVVTSWANNDGNKYNDIDTDSYPIIRNDQQYAVPLFAKTTQPG